MRKIQTFVDLIFQEEHKNLSVNGKGYFLRMQETASRMQAHIEDLLTYSRAKITERIFEKTDLAIIAKGSKLNNEKLLPKTDYCHIVYIDNGIGFDLLKK